MNEEKKGEREGRRERERDEERMNKEEKRDTEEKQEWSVVACLIVIFVVFSSDDIMHHLE